MTWTQQRLVHTCALDKDVRRLGRFAYPGISGRTKNRKGCTILTPVQTLQGSYGIKRCGLESVSWRFLWSSFRGVSPRWGSPRTRRWTFCFRPTLCPLGTVYPMGTYALWVSNRLLICLGYTMDSYCMYP